ncbi:MAG: hypothetical protein AAFY45_03280 [Bacteroidota bacterium]
MNSLIAPVFMLLASSFLIDKSFAQNRKFPQLPARTLSGQDILYPNALAGEKSLLVLVFEEFGKYQRPQNQANQWLAIWESRIKNQGIPAHEIPMMGGGFRLFRGWIDEGMRGGIPDENHGTVSCFYGDKGKYRKILNIESYDEAQIFLLDETGCILFQTSGAPNQESIEGLLGVL